MIEIRHIEEKDQQQLAHVIRSVFEEYGAPLVNTVYDDPRTGSTSLMQWLGRMPAIWL